MYNPLLFRQSPWKPSISTPSRSGCRTSGPAPRICGGIFDFDGKKRRLEALNKELEDPRVWSDSRRAQELGREKKGLETIVERLETTCRVYR